MRMHVVTAVVHGAQRSSCCRLVPGASRGSHGSPVELPGSHGVLPHSRPCEHGPTRSRLTAFQDLWLSRMRWTGLCRAAAIWKAGDLAWLQHTGQLKACMWQAGLEDLASVEVVASFPRITCAHTAVVGASAADTKDSVRPPGAFAVRLGSESHAAAPGLGLSGRMLQLWAVRSGR